MHSAKLSRSPRLQRALRFLQEAGGPVTTRAIMRGARVCAVNTVIAELRENGAKINCFQIMKNGERRFFYALIKSPEGWE